MTDWSKFTVPELREKLSELNLDCEGLKPALVNRLQIYFSRGEAGTNSKEFGFDDARGAEEPTLAEVMAALAIAVEENKKLTLEILGL